MAEDAVAAAAATGATAQPPVAAQMAVATMGAQPQQHPMYSTSALMQQQAQTRQAHMQQQHNMAELNNKLAIFWNEQLEEVRTASDFKNHLLPLARIKKIMKSDEDVRMISAEAPVLFAKACEMFILELTHRAWAQTEEAKRRTLQRSDISTAIQKTDIFDFLIDIVPRDDPKKDDVRAVVGGVDPQQQMQYYMQNPAAGYAMPGQMPAAAAAATGGAEQASVMYQPNQQAAYASGGYTAGMYPPGMVNPQYMRVPQQAAVMYAPQAQNYSQNYLTGNTTEQPPPQS